MQSTNANWVAVDNFVLRYYGPSITGDIDGDGKVSIADVTALIKMILGKPSTEVCERMRDLIADVNGDGNITIADVTALVNHITQQ